MARIKIEMPSSVAYTAEIAVRASDLNYGGHVGNDSILTLIQEARISYYRSIGFENELHLEGDTGQIIADAAVVYQSESFYGDVLLIAISVGEIEKFGFELYYKITNKATGKNVALAKTGIVCFDYVRKNVARVPDLFSEKLRATG